MAAVGPRRDVGVELGSQGIRRQSLRVRIRIQVLEADFSRWTRILAFEFQSHLRNIFLSLKLGILELELVS